ncbi:hypothetical protein EJ06DRAFT_205728 [Trichodelitschia bisporula]|uniref:Uncharacterized protein n=1 Tax=Trichodelitschia bisporula TaxID=703511 RepID=A0A6G1I8U4_9PEZI|nr:hypothetical protein EJ06DRAFT_205728 [Trichodelitschia bisporula]
MDMWVGMRTVRLRSFVECSHGGDGRTVERRVRVGARLEVWIGGDEVSTTEAARMANDSPGLELDEVVWVLRALDLIQCCVVLWTKTDLPGRQRIVQSRAAVRRITVE